MKSVMQKLAMALIAIGALATTAQAATGTKHYGKCYVKEMYGGREVTNAYSCQAANVSCPNPEWGGECTVDGKLGTFSDGERARRNDKAL